MFGVGGAGGLQAEEVGCLSLGHWSGEGGGRQHEKRCEELHCVNGDGGRMEKGWKIGDCKVERLKLNVVGGTNTIDRRNGLNLCQSSDFDNFLVQAQWRCSTPHGYSVYSTIPC